MIVFDLDGTLIDSWPGLWLAIEQDLAGQQGQLDLDMLRHGLSLGITSVCQLAVSQAGLTGDAAAQAGARIAQRYARTGWQVAHPYEGAGHMLQMLHEHGFALGLCTNRSRPTTDALLESLGWQGFFSASVCLDEGMAPKPAPAPLLAVIERLGGAAPALFVGDSHIDAACAAAAGVDFAAHLNGYHNHPSELDPQVFGFARHAELAQWLGARPSVTTETNHG